ncbi:hypothetical protein [Micromonospora sp. WMMD1082]|uniref:hypothetical protein n=1 Tax=Micromonospora sp. WMMD1082 TaxID=3016104 RepID=UPI002416775E|nr:hypothetical protein [Micromonospora sp. WMMD1082]MDG4794710.1 hypothetical protein [Micromonospora sp. WMMD1082]
MSTGEFSEVDHDLLADYLGGALDGTAEQAEIARLVAQDPAWAQAHARLAPAVDGIRAELAEWGEPALELPPEIADRISSALAATDLPGVARDDVAPAPTAPDDPDLADLVRPPVMMVADSATGDSADTGEPDPTDSTDPTGAPESAGGRPTVVPAQPLGGPRRPGGPLRPGQERSAPARPGQRRRRWARVAGPVALAAAAVVGLGALQLTGPNGGDDTASDTVLSDRGASPVVPHAYPQGSPERATDEGAEGASALALPSFRIAGTPQRSDTDYTPEALARAMSTVRQFTSGADPEVGAQNEERLPGPGDLTRLGDQTALSACLAEISAEHGRQPLVFDVVDYARFQGLPALVVRFTDSSGVSWAWVSGPECGVPGSGSDARYRTRVG